MKILILDPDINKKDNYVNLLKPVANKEEITQCLTAQELLDYIRDYIVKPQAHIDLLITEFNIPDRPVAELIDLIRGSQETFSFHNFKLSALPIVLFTSVDPRLDYTQLDVNIVANNNNQEEIDDFPNKLISVIKDWRRKIYDDLEILGIGMDYNFNQINMGYAVKVKAHQTKILSISFVLSQQKLPYLWLNTDFFEVENSINKLEKLINQYLDYPKEKLERLQWEAQFQEFFKNHPSFLFEDKYSKFWSQPTLKILNTKKSYKPDLIMKPIVAPELSKNWEIIDLKLPIMEFVQQTDFHPIFTAKFAKCLQQIRDYKNYFMQDANKNNIEKVLDFHPKFPKLTLVIGKRNSLYQNQNILFQRMNEHNYADISLMAYDEIVDKRKRELEKLMEIRI
ncbi:MAG: DUF4263 domain-containing protein [Bacteroidetes bacterium]|nr:DUF4263 domain-containing protein [Bacteroidota bacterium]